MNNLLKTLILFVLISYWPVSSWATSHEELNERNYFQFVIPEYHTTRQSGQTLDVYVRYAYKPGLPTSEYPDYRLLRTRILKYMEPSEELPAEVFWEIIATSMGRELMHDFPLTGVSVQLYVHDNQNPDSFEPGDHGPTFTAGDITPLDIHH
ncbi:hypothetical protein [Legionella shakespearei]|uniref:Uncharacterized protein n=1 Tax=Legionella shakespearei DSM 23087 TaxID=1122169 RepID=A0A0W0YWH4_9GAMM|nr:hypothetical protein [Legionella shakespearei]KTD60915.1 hypothetical protein Lsha_1326 [Legionella shakespearei DSM 23087]